MRVGKRGWKEGATLEGTETGDRTLFGKSSSTRFDFGRHKLYRSQAQVQCNRYEVVGRRGRILRSRNEVQGCEWKEEERVAKETRIWLCGGQMR